MMNEWLDRADTCACPITAELSKAVSVSLGLDTVSQNQCFGGAFADFDPATAAHSSSSSSSGAARNLSSEVGRLLLGDGDPRGGEFGDVCHGLQQVSCMDLLRSGDLESAHSVTRGAAMPDRKSVV